MAWALKILFFYFVFFVLSKLFPSHAAIRHSRSSFLPLFLMLPPPPLSCSLFVLDHFLSFQVSRPVEADHPSSRGRSTPYCLGGVSVSICSRYAHSPDPLCVGGWGTGWPPAHSGRHLLQQQALSFNNMIILRCTRPMLTQTHTHSAYTAHIQNTNLCHEGRAVIRAVAA